MALSSLGQTYSFSAHFTEAYGLAGARTGIVYLKIRRHSFSKSTIRPVRAFALEQC